MASNRDYQLWDEDYEDPAHWARPGSSEAINHNRQLRRKPSSEDRLIRQKNRRTAADEGDQVAMDRAEIQRQIMRAASFQEKLAWVDRLDAYDREQALRSEAAQGHVHVQNDIAERMAPANLYQLHTASTDWLGDVDTTPSDWHQRVVAEAAVWYAGRPDFVRADREELGIQAQGKANQVAGQYGLHRTAAYRTFMDYVSFLTRTAESENDDGPGGEGSSPSSGSSSTESGSGSAASGANSTTTPAASTPGSTSTATPPSATSTSTPPVVANVHRFAESENDDGGGAEGSGGGSESSSGSGSASSGANGSTSTTPAAGGTNGGSSSSTTSTPPTPSGSSTSTPPPVTAHWRYEAASGLDQIQQVTAPDGVTQKSTPLPAEVFDNFAPDIDPINQGVSGTESSTRNQLIQEIMSGGSHMDGGGAEQVGGHSTADDLSWSPPSGMQKDTAPGWSDGDPGSPEDKDEHNTGFESGSEFSKHVSAVRTGPITLDHYREMFRRAEGKAEGRRGGRTASSTPDAGNVADDLFDSEEDSQAKLDNPALTSRSAAAEKEDEHTESDDLSWSPPSGMQHDSKPPVKHEGAVDYSNHRVENHGNRWHVVGPSGESEGGHHSENAAHEHLDWLKNKAGADPEHIHGGGLGGAGWHQTTRYASYLDEQGKNRSDEDYDPRERYPHSYSRDDIKKALDAHDMDEGSHEKMAGLDGLFHTAASGLDQIDQVVDPNNQVKQTEYPTDVMFPLSGEFGSEYSTHGTGTVSKGQDNPQPNPQHDSQPAPGTASKSAAKSEPYYSYGTPSAVMEASQDAEHFTNRALHSGNAQDHVKAAHEHAHALNTLYDSGHDDALLEAHHKSRMNYHEDRAHKLHMSREARILNKVADMFGASDMPHKILQPVPNNSSTTPERPEQGSKSQGSSDCADPNAKPTFSDNSSHIPAGANSYAEGYSGRDKDHYAPKNVPPSTLKPGEGVTHAGSSKTSHLITTAADRSDPEFVKGYAYATNWKVTLPIVSLGSSSFEAGIYAGLTDTPSVRPHFVEASKARGMSERVTRHAAITQELAKALGVKVASSSMYLDTDAPNTSPSGDGSTPINGRGKPGPLDGKETGSEGPGGPSPYNGANPKGHSVVPGAASTEPAHPTDQLLPQSGYTTPRNVEKASAFRRRVQAALREANKR